MATEQQPFRFPDLPKELRLMVYERLVTRTHHPLGIRQNSEKRPNRAYGVLLVVSDSMTHIHLTCKIIYVEVAAFLRELYERGIDPRIVFDFGRYVDLEGCKRRCEYVSTLTQMLGDTSKDDDNHREGTVDEAIFRHSGKWDGGSHVAHRALLHRAWSHRCKSRPVHLHIALQRKTFVAGHVSHFVKEMQEWDSCGVAVTVYEGADTSTGGTVVPEVQKALYGGLIDEKAWLRDWA